MTQIIERPMTPEEIAEQKEWNSPEAVFQREHDSVTEFRRSAYQLESDPIYFQAQRGDSYTLDDWKAKIAEIDARYPYPVAPKASK